MTPFVFIAWTLLCVGGSVGLMYFIMHSHMQVQLSKQREELAAAQAALSTRKEQLDESLRNAEESVRRKALDDFLADIRVEERHYTREHKVLFMTRKLLVHQERIYFRNIPLSNWVEQELPIEEGVDAERMAQTMSIFVNAALLGEVPPVAVRKLLR
jgi:hypothetical protein